MYDQSFNIKTLSAMLRRSDFKYRMTIIEKNEFRKSIVEKAKHSADSIFNNKNPIQKFHLKKKSAYKIAALENDLVVRKLAKNLKTITNHISSNRSNLVKNLSLHLEEGVPYRVYRLDIQSFYESFRWNVISDKLESLRGLSPTSKRLFLYLFESYKNIGGIGLPRGMAISAVISDFMMIDFDLELSTHHLVNLYGRYVDDIVIITDRSEKKKSFISKIKKILPEGLYLNDKKLQIESVLKIPKNKELKNDSFKRFSIDYLGYEFSIFDPPKGENSIPRLRKMRIEIAPVKVRKLKTRIVRSLLDYQRNQDRNLLIDRIKFITSNFSVFDQSTGKHQLTGIYYNYPMLVDDSESLKLLDKFLKNSILSKKGRLFGQLNIPPQLKRRILSHSFRMSFIDRRFVYFHPTRIKKIQECWAYE